MDSCVYFKDYLVSRVLTTTPGKVVDGYNLMYYQTNEDLKTYYKDKNFEDKKVLTVLASSDQYITSKILGAKVVDTFDMNRLSLYYYYLRRWSIMYMNELYPNIYSYEFMSELLNKVIPSSFMEKRALIFYKTHLDEETDLDKMFYEIYTQPKGGIIYNKAQEIKNYLDSDISFKQLNLFEPFQEELDYDIVIISNILEWARNDEFKLSVAAKNLSDITKTGAEVICTSFDLFNKNEDDQQNEIKIFNKYFDYKDIDNCKNYIYKRK